MFGRSDWAIHHRTEAHLQFFKVFAGESFSGNRALVRRRALSKTSSALIIPSQIGKALEPANTHPSQAYLSLPEVSGEI